MNNSKYGGQEKHYTFLIHRNRSWLEKRPLFT